MNHFSSHSIRLRNKSVEINRPWVMGILNVTPDSFFADSRCNECNKITHRIHTIVEEGADIIDIGGYSSRPGAFDISPNEEYKRLSEGLSIIKRYYPDIIVSVDTFRADIAKRCVKDWNVDIINDISGGTLDEQMFDTVAELQVPYILMHMRGTPNTMQNYTQYNNVVHDVISELQEFTNKLKSKGINDIIIDPGFGFAKTCEQNFELLNHLDDFNNIGRPILVGISRKSMIYKSLSITPETSLNGTSVLNTIALLKGASILRVHDVKEAVETIKLTQLTINAQS